MNISANVESFKTLFHDIMTSVVVVEGLRWSLCFYCSLSIFAFRMYNISN